MERVKKEEIQGVPPASQKTCSYEPSSVSEALRISTFGKIRFPGHEFRLAKVLENSVLKRIGLYGT